MTLTISHTQKKNDCLEITLQFNWMSCNLRVAEFVYVMYPFT